MTRDVALRDKKRVYRDEVVEVSVGRGAELERPEADVVECLVVDTKRFVCIFDQLVN